MNPLVSNLVPNEIMMKQTQQYSDKILLSGQIEAGQSNIITASVSSLGHFYCTHISGSFSTLKENAGIFDDGVNYLRGQLRDGTNSKNLFSDFMPLNLVLSPGRVRHATAINNDTTAEKSNDTYVLRPFFYMFSVDSTIVIEVKNGSDVTNYLDILLHGVRILKQLR